MPIVDIEVNKTFTWDYDKCILRTYRVQGVRKMPTAKDLQHGCTLPFCNLDGQQKLIVNITSCSVEAVCARLKGQDWLKSLDNLYVFNQPVFNDDPKIDDELSPLFLINVTPEVENCAECCELLIDEDLEQDFGGTFDTFGDFPDNDASGELVLSGTFGVLWKQTLVAGGNMVLYGTTNVISSQHNYETSGMMIIGEEFGVTSSIHTYGASGEMVINNGSSVASASYTYSMSGTMVITSETVALRDGCLCRSDVLTTKGDMLIFDDDYERLPIGDEGQVLSVSSEGLPAWEDVDGGTW